MSEREFDEAYKKTSPLMDCLRPTFESEDIVFFGCRLEEPDMPNVFATCKERQLNRQRIAMEQGRNAKSPPLRYILLPKPEIYDDNSTFDERRSREALSKQTEQYKNMEIEPVWYVANGTDPSALRVAFGNLANLSDVTPNYGWDGGLNGN